MEISLEERKQIQLKMLIEIDEFCRKNKIRYTLAYGTLIGAIRHKGFIPWDDDVDIMMPLPDLIRFKKQFSSKTMCYCDVDIEKKYQFAFSRIANTETFNKEGLISKTYGICIDLYPVLGLPDTIPKVNNFFIKARIELERRLKIIQLRKRIIKVLPLMSIPYFNKAMKRFRDFMFQYPYEGSKLYFTYGGPIDMRNVFDFDLFEEMIEVTFEGHTFLAISKFDNFLRQYYGDYMRLPPEEQRVPYHGGKYYWKK